MNLKEVREALRELKDKLLKDVEEDVFIGYKGFGTVHLEPSKLKVLGAFDVLDDYLDDEIISELLDDYTDEELTEEIGSPKNLMGILIETKQIKLTPSPGAKGADCPAYRDTVKENACWACAYHKICFPDGIPFPKPVDIEYH